MFVLRAWVCVFGSRACWCAVAASGKTRDFRSFTYICQLRQIYSLQAGFAVTVCCTCETQLLANEHIYDDDDTIFLQCMAGSNRDFYGDGTMHEREKKMKKEMIRGGRRIQWAGSRGGEGRGDPLTAQHTGRAGAEGGQGTPRRLSGPPAEKREGNYTLDISKPFPTIAHRMG